MGLVSKPYTFSNATVADATQVNSDLDTLYTLVNGNIESANITDGTIVDADMAASIPAYSTYKTLVERSGRSSTAAAAATYVIPDDAGGTMRAAGDVACFTTALFYLDPADYTAGTRATKYRLRATITVNAAAPTTNWTVGLYPVGGWGGASGAGPIITSLGVVASGSTVLFTAPSASSPATGSSGDFTPPSASWFVLAVVNSGAAAAGSVVSVNAQLQMRQV